MDEDKKSNEKSELYYKLLHLVNVKSENGLQKLEEDLKNLADENPEDWKELINWDLEDQYEIIRQDAIPGGVKSKYSHSQLLQRSTSKFDSLRFYDFNQYLSELVLLAQIVDDEFQKSMQNIFNINKKTNIGHIISDDHEEKEIDKNRHQIQYIKGPVKLIKRARAKAMNDYSQMKYPTSACVLDLNRCSLIFNDIKTMLAAIKLFENKIKYYQSGNIIDIVRDKNGFMEYIRDDTKESKVYEDKSNEKSEFWEKMIYLRVIFYSFEVWLLSAHDILICAVSNTLSAMQHLNQFALFIQNISTKSQDSIKFSPIHILSLFYCILSL